MKSWRNLSYHLPPRPTTFATPPPRTCLPYAAPTCQYQPSYLPCPFMPCTLPPVLWGQTATSSGDLVAMLYLRCSLCSLFSCDNLGRRDSSAPYHHHSHRTTRTTSPTTAAPHATLLLPYNVFPNANTTRLLPLPFALTRYLPEHTHPRLCHIPVQLSCYTAHTYRWTTPAPHLPTHCRTTRYRIHHHHHFPTTAAAAPRRHAFTYTPLLATYVGDCLMTCATNIPPPSAIACYHSFRYMPLDVIL